MHHTSRMSGGGGGGGSQYANNVYTGGGGGGGGLMYSGGTTAQYPMNYDFSAFPPPPPPSFTAPHPPYAATGALQVMSPAVGGGGGSHANKAPTMTHSVKTQRGNSDRALSNNTDHHFMSSVASRDPTRIGHDLYTYNNFSAELPVLSDISAVKDSLMRL